MFVFENVLGIFTAKGGEPFRDLIRLVRELDYNIDFREQIASQHGVLQKRHRVIIVGWQNKETHKKIPRITIRTFLKSKCHTK